jgi:hypothetical protein
LLGDGKFALGFFLGSLTTLVSYMAYEAFGGALNELDYATIVPLMVSLIVAMGSTYFAASALLEQRTMREASTDPVLIAHLGQREDARELVTFKVSNVGAGAALNVAIEVERPDDCEDDWKKRNFITDIFLPRPPYSVIPQGESIEFNLTLGWLLFGQTSTPIDPNQPIKTLPPLKARLTYEDLSGGGYSSEFTLDVRELAGLGAQKSPQMRIVSALEKIAMKT